MALQAEEEVVIDGVPMHRTPYEGGRGGGNDFVFCAVQCGGEEGDDVWCDVYQGGTQVVAVRQSRYDSLVCIGHSTRYQLQSTRYFPVDLSPQGE